MALFEVVLLLAAAFIVLPLSKRLRFAAVPGLWGLGLNIDVERIMYLVVCATRKVAQASVRLVEKDTPVEHRRERE